MDLCHAHIGSYRRLRMPEAAKMVHLTPAQRKRKKFSHLLTDNVPPPLPEEEIIRLIFIYFSHDKEDELRIEAGKKLVVNYFRLLRSTVARYLYHWPITRRFLDEMISSGTESITRIVFNLKPEQLKEDARLYSLTGLVESAIRTDIENTVNRLRGIVPAPRRTNCRREKDQKKPVYGSVEAGLTSESVKNAKEYVDTGLFVFETKDAIDAITRTNLERQILAQDNWGLSNVELSKKIGASPQHIGRLRHQLRQRYMKLGECYV